MKSNGIIAEGRERALNEPSNWKGFHEIAIDIRNKYKDKILKAGFLKRFYLNYKMNLELKQAKNRWVEKFAPKGGLYISNHDQT